ncbi:Cytochrome c heme-binding site [Mycena kentingensis (nom. inval.)]|nr:Cytochrome c heme-binding site [Mycena kentingensis (nom. inval.)]
MFFCIPILCGCESNIQPNGEVQTARICPNCHNASVFSGKNSEWFTFFFVPLFPLSSKHVWLCGTCRWMAPHAPGHFEPAIAFGGGFPPQGPPMMPMQPSYQPGYGAATPAPK